MQCKNMQIVGTQKAGNRRLVPCGKCIACRINVTSEWTLRLMYEREYWNKANFITLTYDDVHLPQADSLFFKGTLKPSDSTLFWKNIRKDLGDEKIKYYLCGEYGDKGHRAHMHSVVYGLDTSQNTADLIYENWQKCDYAYFYGHLPQVVGSATHDSMQYVAGYCQKKLYDDMKLYENEGVQKPFSRQSQGLGLQYFLDNQKLLEEQGILDFKGRELPVPKYYKDKYPDMAFIQQNALDNLNTRIQRLVDKYGLETVKEIAHKHMLSIWHPETIREDEIVIRNREKRYI